jgi:DNA repair protein RecO (recombination protein O)
MPAKAGVAQHQQTSSAMSWIPAFARRTSCAPEMRSSMAPSGANSPTTLSRVPTICDIAICIRHWDFSETSQTVSLFSRDHGVIRGLAKGSRREKASFSGGIDLFALGEVRAIIKSGTDLANIIEWTLLDAHWPLRDNLAAHRRALYFADLIHHMVHDHDAHTGLFRAFAQSLANLAGENRMEQVTASFLWTLLAETGYRPVVERDAHTGQELPAGDQLAFDSKAGGIVAAGPGLQAWRIRPETLAILQRLARGEHGDGPEEPESLRPRAQDSPEAARRAACLFSAYIRTILGYEPATLKWVFPELTGQR